MDVAQRTIRSRRERLASDLEIAEAARERQTEGEMTSRRIQRVAYLRLSERRHFLKSQCIILVIAKVWNSMVLAVVRFGPPKLTPPDHVETSVDLKGRGDMSKRPPPTREQLLAMIAHSSWEKKAALCVIILLNRDPAQNEDYHEVAIRPAPLRRLRTNRYQFAGNLRLVWFNRASLTRCTYIKGSRAERNRRHRSVRQCTH